MTSKLPYPHYLPEIWIKLTIINFTVTFEWLEEQMLVDVVIDEKPETEKARDTLVLNLAALESEKRNVEIKILKTLADPNEETILDGDQLIEILETSKYKTSLIKCSFPNPAPPPGCFKNYVDSKNPAPTLQLNSQKN